MNKFLSELSDRQRIVVFVTATIVTLALFDRLLFGPTMSKLRVVDEQIAREEEQVRQDAQYMARKDNILKEAKSFEPYYTDKIPSEEEIIAGFLKRIELLAGKAGVTLGKINSSGQTREDQYLKYTADLECAGTLEGIVSFIHAIDSSKDLLKVAKFSMGSKRTDTDDVKAILTVSKMIISSHLQPIASLVPEKKDKLGAPQGKTTQ